MVLAAATEEVEQVKFEEEARVKSAENERVKVAESERVKAAEKYAHLQSEEDARFTTEAEARFTTEVEAESYGSPSKRKPNKSPSQQEEVINRPNHRSLTNQRTGKERKGEIEARLHTTPKMKLYSRKTSTSASPMRSGHSNHGTK